MPDYAAVILAIITRGIANIHMSIAGFQIVKEMRIMLSPNLTKSAIIIMHHLKVDGPMSPKQIAAKSQIPARTVSFALRTLIKQKICRKVPNLLDMRQPTYHLNDEMVKNIRAHVMKLQAELGIHLKGF